MPMLKAMAASSSFCDSPSHRLLSKPSREHTLTSATTSVGGVDLTSQDAGHVTSMRQSGRARRGDDAAGHAPCPLRKCYVSVIRVILSRRQPLSKPTCHRHAQAACQGEALRRYSAKFSCSFMALALMPRISNYARHLLCS